MEIFNRAGKFFYVSEGDSVTPPPEPTLLVTDDDTFIVTDDGSFIEVV